MKFIAALVSMLFLTGPLPAYSPGDLVRTTKKDTLVFMGEPLLGAPKGQEFTVLKHQAGSGVIYLAFIQKEGAVVAVTLPENSVEPVPMEGWTVMLRGVQLFRDQRIEDARKVLAEAAKDPAYRSLAQKIVPSIESVATAARPALQTLGEFQSGGGNELAKLKLTSAQQTFASATQKSKEVAAELDTMGYTSLAFALEEGLDRLTLKIAPSGASLFPMPSSKTKKADLE